MKGRNICHLEIVVTHVNSHFFEPGDENRKFYVPEKTLYHKDILGKWAKDHCLTAPISLNQGEGQWSLNITIEGDRYEVPNPFTIFVCGAELELSQVSLNDHYEILHGLRIKAMDKYSFIFLQTAS